METKVIVGDCRIGFRSPQKLEERDLQKRFLSLWGPSRGNALVWGILKSAYAEPHRQFHTLRHVGECLQMAEQYAAIVGWSEVPLELQLALWFHDVVYEPGAKDNERRSAHLFESLATGSNLRSEVIAEVVELILETKMLEARGVVLSSIMCDCDLWVLGSRPERYREYREQVRREHARYGDAEYRVGRSRFLCSVLAREHIFNNPLFEEAFGEQARLNLEFEMKSLRRPSLGASHLLKKCLPGLNDYFVVSFDLAETSSEAQSLLLSSAGRYARRLAFERYGDPECYALVFNGARVRRREWPQVHIVLARTRTQRRYRLLLLYFKSPLRMGRRVMLAVARLFRSADVPWRPVLRRAR